jgi:hypothetical protein
LKQLIHLAALEKRDTLIDGMIGLKTHPASLIIYLIVKKMIRGIEFANEKWVDGLVQSDLQWHPASNSSLSPSQLSRAPVGKLVSKNAADGK